VGAADYGFRALIAPSYADIFFNNCYKNGCCRSCCAKRRSTACSPSARGVPGFKLTIDLERQTVATPDGGVTFGFDVDPFRKHCLLNGLDEIGLTLQHADEIRGYEAKHRRAGLSLACARYVPPGADRAWGGPAARN
jgi:3-isopropylmalate/(R)-2-methylmalate dehydratase small subunit